MLYINNLFIEKDRKCRNHTISNNDNQYFEIKIHRWRGAVTSHTSKPVLITELGPYHTVPQFLLGGGVDTPQQQIWPICGQ